MSDNKNESWSDLGWRYARYAAFALSGWVAHQMVGDNPYTASVEAYLQNEGIPIQLESK